MATRIEERFEMGQLMAELRHYLIAVDAFRAEGREPVWLREERQSQWADESEPAPPKGRLAAG
jgi:hypothetical protein